jgi:hypothetical protein
LDVAINELKSKPSRKSGSNLPSAPLNHHIAQLLKCIKTSCVPIGYTTEASSEARNKIFAVWMTFGPPSLLFTFSLFDKCSFRMQLIATRRIMELPSLVQTEEILCHNITLWKSLKVKYPGSCAKEFDSLLK